MSGTARAKLLSRDRLLGMRDTAMAAERRRVAAGEAARGALAHESTFNIS